MSSYVPASLRRLVIERAHHLCEYCLILEEDTFLGCEVEHIISEKHGGPTVEANLALACVFCNRNKGTDIAAVAVRSGHLSRLFNPRTDRWSEHFALNGSQILPLTDVGDATIALLKLNHPDRVLERETLMTIARYPSEAARKHALSPRSDQ